MEKPATLGPYLRQCSRRSSLSHGTGQHMPSKLRKGAGADAVSISVLDLQAGRWLLGQHILCRLAQNHHDSRSRIHQQAPS